MEVGLGANLLLSPKGWNSHVLILVLMEVGLGERTVKSLRLYDT